MEESDDIEWESDDYNESAGPSNYQYESISEQMISQLNHIDGTLSLHEANVTESSPGPSNNQSETIVEETTVQLDESLPSLNEISVNAAGVKKNRSAWTNQATLSLIKHYKTRAKEFEKKNIKILDQWKKIAKDINNDNDEYMYTGVQCQNKFKMLKKSYQTKLLNMSTKSTGSSVYHCPYFEEMDDTLKKEPTCNPIVIASSSTGITYSKERADALTGRSEALSSDQLVDLFEDDVQPVPKKRKKRNQNEVLAQLQEIRADRKLAETNKQIRHDQNMEKQEQHMTVFSNLMSKLIDKI